MLVFSTTGREFEAVLEYQVNYVSQCSITAPRQSITLAPADNRLIREISLNKFYISMSGLYNLRLDISVENFASSA
jgi:hypothetical protein